MRPQVWSVSEFIFLSLCILGPVLSLATSSSHRQCTCYILNWIGWHRAEIYKKNPTLLGIWTSTPITQCFHSWNETGSRIDPLFNAFDTDSVMSRTRNSSTAWPTAQRNNDRSQTTHRRLLRIATTLSKTVDKDCFRFDLLRLPQQRRPEVRQTPLGAVKSMGQLRICPIVLSGQMNK